MSSHRHEASRVYIEQLRHGHTAWFLAWNIIYEFLRVVTHARVLREPWDTCSAWRFVEALWASPHCTVVAPSHRHRDVAQAFFEEFRETRANLIHDARTAILMREHGIAQVCTYDMDFHRLGVRVVTPENT